MPGPDAFNLNAELFKKLPMQYPQIPTTPPAVSDDDEIDLLALFGTLLDHKWLIAGITAGFMVVGAAYPNEFGVICSFYALYSVLLSQSKKRAMAYLPLSIVFIAGVFLTSTRAAYITLVAGYAYIVFSTPGLMRRLALCLLPILFAPTVIVVLGAFSFDVIDVITRGYDSAANQTGSSNVRMEDWEAALDDLLDNFYFGVGFESPKAYSLHNLPLQIAYGLGLLGTSLLVLAFILFAYTNSKSPWAARVYYSPDWSFLHAVRMILLFHVLIFGLTNHNQAHFFTWMLFALCCIRIRTCGPVPRSSGTRVLVRNGQRRLSALGIGAGTNA